MELSRKQIEELERICAIAEDYYEKNYRLPDEELLLARIRKYREMFVVAIDRLEGAKS